MGYRSRLSGLGCAAAVAALLCAAPAQADAPFQRGFVLTGWKSNTYLTARADGVVRKMADAGSSHAAVLTQWFMDSATSSHIAPDVARTPSDAAIAHVAAQAQQDGLEVTLKPQIGIYSGAWIGGAHPADLDAFWADYRTMLLHYADVAERVGASTLVVGTEMRTLSSDDAHWRSLIAEVREHFHGALTYAANYDEYESVPFWDALDFIGIDAYFPLADDSDPAPSVADLTMAWSARGYLDDIAAVSRRFGKRVLFTEIGYRGVHTTAAHPNLWNVTKPTDVQAQANAYEAFYSAVAGQPWMAGVYWWEANADSWIPQDYSPLGKPAAEVMSAWNRAQVELSTPPLPADPVAPPVPPPPPADPQPEPALTDVPAATAAAGTAVVTQVAPQKAVPPAVATRPHTTIYVKLRAKRLVGAVAPYSPRCHGQVRLRARVKRGSKWRNVAAPAPLSVSPAGVFARRMPAGPLRVKAIYTSGCSSAGSRWVSSGS